MLVLSRQRDESIMVGDNIEITVVDIRGGKVRLGINAPKGLAVHRKEVYDAIKAEQKNQPVSTETPKCVYCGGSTKVEAGDYPAGHWWWECSNCKKKWAAK